jgi:hypothetical protein
MAAMTKIDNKAKDIYSSLNWSSSMNTERQTDNSIVPSPIDALSRSQTINDK